MVAPLPVYSCHYHSARVQDLVSRAALLIIIAPNAVPLPWRGVTVFAHASQMRKSRLLTTVQIFPARQTVQLRNGVPWRDSGKVQEIEESALALRKVCPAIEITQASF